MKYVLSSPVDFDGPLRQSGGGIPAILNGDMEIVLADGDDILSGKFGHDNTFIIHHCAVGTF